MRIVSSSPHTKSISIRAIDGEPLVRPILIYFRDSIANVDDELATLLCERFDGISMFIDNKTKGGR